MYNQNDTPILTIYSHKMMTSSSDIFYSVARTCFWCQVTSWCMQKGGGVTVFFSCFKTIQIVSYRRDEALIWLIFHLFGNLSDNN